MAQVYYKPLLSSFINWVTNTGQDAGSSAVSLLLAALTPLTCCRR